MKAGVVIISVILALIPGGQNILCQEDSIINVYCVTCTVLKTSAERDLKGNKIVYSTSTKDIEDLRSLTFVKDDSMIMIKGDDSLYTLNVNEVLEFNKIKGNHIVPGIILGTIIGGISGFAIGSSGPYMTTGNINVCTLLGSGAGALIGYIMGSLIIDYETLDLRNTPSEVKKIKLLEFIRQKR